MTWFNGLFVCFFLLTLVGVYLLSFWLDRQLLHLGVEGTVFIMLLILAAVEAMDLFFLNWVTNNVIFIAIAFHIALLLFLSLCAERIQRIIGYPYKV